MSSRPPSPSNFRRRLGVAAAIAALLGGGACYFFLREGTPPTPPPAPATEPAVARGNEAPAPADMTIDARLAERVKALAQGVSPDEARALLAAAAAELQAAERAAAVAAIVRILDTGVDAKTGLDFRIGPGGDLSGAPTLRVWLLDQLGRLDPAAAARYAQKIYARADSPDEWAVALRNDWRDGVRTGRIAEVRARALELTANESWAAQPSAGFLEGVDITVASLAWEAVPRFEDWLGASRPKALRNAAWIALDRMTMEMPEDFLGTLVHRPQWLQSQPMLRAGLMARADLSADWGRTVVERYLSRPDLTPQEGARFFEIIPNAGSTVSYNLVTTARSIPPQQMARQDQAALATIQAWQRRPEMARWAAELKSAETRLTEAVASATRGGYLTP